MQIIKEFRPAGNEQKAIAVIRTNTYVSTLAHFLLLHSQACETFPNLKFADIRIKCYGGRHYEGTFGLEFDVDSQIKSLVQHGYRDIKELEQTCR